MKISFIIPTYNCQDRLFKLLNILTQISKDKREIIVIDDGSTDNTKEMITEYKSKDIVYYCQNNAGVSAARNKGIELAKGEYYIFLDADDEIDIEIFDDIYNYISSDCDKADIYMHGYDVIDGDNYEKVMLPLQEGKYGEKELIDLKKGLIDVKFAKKYCTKYFGGKVYQYFIRKEIFTEKKLIFPSHLQYAEDLCFCYKLFSLASNITIINKSMYKYFVINGSASHKYRNRLWNEWVAVYKYIGEVDNTIDDKKNLLYWAMKKSIRHYIYNEKISINLYRKILQVVNEEDKLIGGIVHFDSWTQNEKIENYLIKKKKILILIAFEKIIINLKKERT